MRKQSWQLQLKDLVPYLGLKTYKERLSNYEWNWDFRRFTFRDDNGIVHNDDFYQDAETEKINRGITLLKVWNFSIALGSLAFLTYKVGLLEKICH
jgi:hypothetical protein